MRKGTIHFEVIGDSLDALEANALDTYRQVTGNQEAAALPHQAYIEVDQGETISTSDGEEVRVVNWVGTVTIPFTRD